MAKYFFVLADHNLCLVTLINTKFMDYYNIIININFQNKKMLTFITSSVKFVFATSSTLFWVSVTLGTFNRKIINIPEPEKTFLEMLIKIKRIGHHAYKRDNASVSSAKLKVPHNPLNFSYKKLAFIRRTISKFNFSWIKL